MEGLENKHLKEKNLFISYSSKDKGYAMQVHDDLKSLGHNPWIDSIDIAAGESIPAKIQDSIDKSDFLIVLMSENSVNSKWVEIEWVTKFWKDVENKNVHVIPAKISDCVVPPLLKTKKYADFTDNYENGLYELLKGIGH